MEASLSPSECALSPYENPSDMYEPPHTPAGAQSSLNKGDDAPGNTARTGSVDTGGWLETLALHSPMPYSDEYLVTDAAERCAGPTLAPDEYDGAEEDALSDIPDIQHAGPSVANLAVSCQYNSRALLRRRDRARV
jgi:hypothetical protein